jgi:hypothetical protein
MQKHPHWRPSACGCSTDDTSSKPGGVKGAVGGLMRPGHDVPARLLCKEAGRRRQCAVAHSCEAEIREAFMYTLSQALCVFLRVGVLIAGSRVGLLRPFSCMLGYCGLSVACWVIAAFQLLIMCS